MSAHNNKVSSVSSSSSFNAPYCGGKVLRRPDPELFRFHHLAEDCQSEDSSFPTPILSSFDLVLSTVVVAVSSANGEESSLCESVPVQGADF